MTTRNSNNNSNQWGTNGFAPSSDINVPGVGPTMASTIFSGNFGSNTDASASAQSGGPTTAASASPPPAKTYGGEPAAVWITMIILLLILKFLGERKESKINPAYIKIGGYNFVAIGLGAAVFFILLKVASTYLPITGLKTFSAAL